MPRGCRLGRGMKKERLHEKGLALARQASDMSVPGQRFLDVGAFKHAMAMAARGDPKGAVFTIALIQMEPDSQQIFQDREGWPGVIDSFLFGGSFEAGSCHRRGKGEHDILMPDHLPVGLGRFVKGDGLDRHRIGVQKARSGQFRAELKGGGADVRIVEQAACARAAFREAGEAQLPDRFRADAGGRKGPAGRFKRVQGWG